MEESRRELGKEPDEWPSPAAEPSGAATGSDPVVRRMMERRREGDVEQGEEGRIDEPEGYDDVLAQVDPAEAASRTQLDPESDRPAPEG